MPQVWNELDEVVKELEEIDIIGDVEHEIIRPLRRIRNQVFLLIVLVGFLAFLFTIIYFEFPPEFQFASYAGLTYLAMFFLLYPYTRIPRSYRRFKKVIDVLEDNQVA